jgi:hypothetical protein
MTMDEHDLVEAESFPTEIAAAIASASLRARGIECVVERQDSSGAAALTRAPEQVRILVRNSNLAAARELLHGVGHADEDYDRNDEPVPSEDQIANGLQEIRRRRRHFWIVFATYLPATGLALLATEAAVPYIAGLWMLGAALTAVRAGWVRCPRCGERFSQRRRATNSFTQECLHCGLRLRTQ